MACTRCALRLANGRCHRPCTYRRIALTHSHTHERSSRKRAGSKSVTQLPSNFYLFPNGSAKRRWSHFYFIQSPFMTLRKAISHRRLPYALKIAEKKKKYILRKMYFLPSAIDEKRRRRHSDNDDYLPKCMCVHRCLIILFVIVQCSVR